MALLIAIDGTEFDPATTSVTNRGRAVQIEAHDTHLVWFYAGKFAARIERQHIAGIAIGRPVVNWLLEFTVAGRTQLFWVKEADGRALLKEWYSVTP